MDINCPNCGEPWDSYHLAHDEPEEWGLTPSDRRELIERGAFAGPDDPARKAAEGCGWRYASDSLYSILRCPCCKSRPVLEDALERMNRARGYAAALDGDNDALASMLAN